MDIVHTITLPKHTLYLRCRSRCYPFPRGGDKQAAPCIPDPNWRPTPPSSPSAPMANRERGVGRPHTSLRPLMCSFAACCSRVHLKHGRAWCFLPESSRCPHGPSRELLMSTCIERSALAPVGYHLYIKEGHMIPMFPSNMSLRQFLSKKPWQANVSFQNSNQGKKERWDQQEANNYHQQTKTPKKGSNPHVK